MLRREESAHGAAEPSSHVPSFCATLLAQRGRCAAPQGAQLGAGGRRSQAGAAAACLGCGGAARTPGKGIAGLPGRGRGGAGKGRRQRVTGRPRRQWVQPLRGKLANCTERVCASFYLSKRLDPLCLRDAAVGNAAGPYESEPAAQPARIPGALAGPPGLEERKGAGSTPSLNSCEEGNESRVNMRRHPKAGAVRVGFPFTPGGTLSAIKVKRTPCSHLAFKRTRECKRCTCTHAYTYIDRCAGFGIRNRQCFPWGENRRSLGSPDSGSPLSRAAGPTRALPPPGGRRRSAASPVTDRSLQSEGT